MVKVNPITCALSDLSLSSLQEFIGISLSKIGDYKGLDPTYVRLFPVKYNSYANQTDFQHCLIARWPDLRLNRRMVDRLESFMENLYAPELVSARKDVFGKATRIRHYKSPAFKESRITKGYLFSDQAFQNRGLFVMRKFGSKSPRLKGRSGWLYEGKGFAELRLPMDTSNLDALESLTRISCILSNQDPEPKSMVCDLYRSLMLTQVEKKQREDLAGLDELLDFMHDTLFSASTNPAAEHYGIKNQSVVLAGVYGVGKTTIAKILAAENNGAIFIPIEARDLVVSLLEGKREKGSVVETIRNLQERTGVDITLFCDDLETAMLRTQRTDGMGNLSLTSTLLSRLQGVGGSELSLSGATNNPYDIDPRFAEFGRAGYFLHVPLPDADARKQVFKVHTRDKPVKARGRFGELVELTEGYTPRHIEEICNRAAKVALDRAAKSIRRRSGETLRASRKRVTPEIAEDFPITRDDFREGYEIVRKHVEFRLKEIATLDRRIQEFCKEKTAIGFGSGMSA